MFKNKEKKIIDPIDDFKTEVNHIKERW